MSRSIRVTDRRMRRAYSEVRFVPVRESMSDA